MMKLLVLVQLLALAQAFLVTPPAVFHGRINSPLFAAESIELVEEDVKERMAKSVESVKMNLSTVRTGRANSAMLDRVKVAYYGVDTPLNQLASISVSSAQQLSVDPYDKSQMGEVEKAIIEADLGLTPTNDGNMIRVNIPSLTEDRRKDMLKQCKAIGEEGKVAVRNIRRDGVDNIKKQEKAGDVGEDEMKDGLDAMQKITDAHIKDIDEIVSAKEKEVATV
ncbi:Ribosome-recycling factor [Seminavis robusta]|uniref:Ribosome-recycling factor n=1 Tax=Seminavis robusta TaxID=568900 RepID=A0A9N8HIV3_9STRA|nr:Ribosome-recycling factor [Seminavis robusta]|eukprot:Sro648_g181050.1 Ribosome-recycling factor (223) ;mRNA; f:28587-29255